MVFQFAATATLLPPDYKTLVIPDAHGVVRRYELASGRALDTVKGDEPPTDALVVVSGDGKRFTVAGKSPGGAAIYLSVWNTATGEVIQKFERFVEHSQATVLGIANMCLSASGTVFAQGSQDKDFKGFVTVWDVFEPSFSFRKNNLGPLSPSSGHWMYTKAAVLSKAASIESASVLS